MARVSDQPERWSQATAYPDMWVDPGEDPRDSAAVSPEGELGTLQAATDAVLAGRLDLSEHLGKDSIAVRDLLVHRIEEYARHCGHADLLRERIDGRVGQ
jgi:hypothetical protein